jgi:hypothetical protein
VICGHPTITTFQDKRGLLTLPALESVMFGAPDVRQADESTLSHPESLTELFAGAYIAVRPFQQLLFHTRSFQATANALMEGTAVTKLEFISSAHFSP